jgi:hypothetical protein
MTVEKLIELLFANNSGSSAPPTELDPVLSGRQKRDEGNINMKTTENALTTHDTEIENIHAAAQQDAGFEKILKFKKGEYFIGEELVPLSTEYLAHTTAWTKSWIKFVNGEVAERKLFRVALGEKPPVREDLDDRDENNWPEGLDGNPTDPWVLQYLLPLEKTSDGEVVIFVTSSVGGLSRRCRSL